MPKSDKKHFRRIDWDTAPYFILSALIFLELLIISAVTGAETAYYAVLPTSFTVLFLLSFISNTSGVAFSQIRIRLKRSRFNDALLFLRAGNTVCIWTALFFTVICTVLSVPTAKAFIGEKQAYLVLFGLVPILIFGSMIGNMKGFLESAGLGSQSRIGMGLFNVLLLIFPILFGIGGNRYGSKVSGLLRFDGYRAIYAAMGLLIGIGFAVIVTFIYMYILTTMVRRQVVERQDYLAIDNEESFSGLVRYYTVKTAPGAAVFLLPFLALSVDLRIARTSSANVKEVSMQAMSGFCSVSLPILIVCAIIGALFFTRLATSVSIDYLKEKRRAMRGKYSILLSLHGFLMIPVSIFIFGAAKPIVRIFAASLNSKSREGAILSMKTGCFLAFLISSAIITFYIYAKCYLKENLVIAMAISFLIQTIMMFLLHRMTSLGIMAISVSLSAGTFISVLIAYFMARRSRLRSADTFYIADYILVFITSGISVIPVILLNDFMANEIIMIGGVILEVFIFIPVFVFLSLYLRAVDLDNIELIPGGKYILHAAEIMQVR